MNIDFESLSSEQRIAYNKYTQHRNIFITGPGGTGKSALITLIVKHAEMYCKHIQVCALTGCAAILIGCGAKTIHSWAGIGLGTSEPEFYIDKIKRNRFLRASWKKTEVLVIDEVSMMSAKLFDLIDIIAKSIRRSQRPFGGIQMIFAGDFYQLPPVPTAGDEKSKQFCFQSKYWPETIRDENIVVLTTNFRQIDPEYQRILNQIRCGILKRREFEKLTSRVGVPFAELDHTVRPTKLFPTRNKVEYINDLEMDALPEDATEHTYIIKYVYDLKSKSSSTRFTEEQKKWELDLIANNIPCNREIVIKEGAQVMCRVNIDLQRELCNGSQGIVIGFRAIGIDKTEYPVVRFDNDVELIVTPYSWESENIPGIAVKQIPLSLSWAMTIHKSQGATLSRAEVDAGSEIFECGQTYVALSRVKTLEGLFLSSFDVRCIQIHSHVKEFYDRLAALPVPSSESTEVISLPPVPVPVPAPSSETTEATLVEYIPVADVHIIHLR